MSTLRLLSSSQGFSSVLYGEQSMLKRSTGTSFLPVQNFGMMAGGATQQPGMRLGTPPPYVERTPAACARFANYLRTQGDAGPEAGKGTSEHGHVCVRGK